MKPRVSKRKVIIRAEINQTGNRKTTEKMNKTELIFFEKIKIDNIFAKFIPPKRKKTQNQK